MAIEKEQLPAGAQISGGAEKNAVGVLEQGFASDGDVLALQAQRMAGNANATVYRTGGEVGADVLERVQGNAFKGVMGVNSETINAMQSGELNRDQAYIGNNANWTGYYLEPAAKFVMPLDTPFRNMLPRMAGVGIDTINWRAITDVFGGNGPSVGNFILQQYGSPQSLSYNWVNQSNLYRMLSVSDTVTFESEIYGQMFEPDMRAKVAAKLIPAMMLGQETWYLNAAQNLWSPAPVSGIATASTGGSLAAATYWVLATAVNGNGETLAYSPTAQSVTTTGTTSTISFNLNRVPGATKYNVYIGSGTSQPANNAMYLQNATAFGGANSLNDQGGLAAGYFTVTLSGTLATSGTAYSSVVTAGNTAVAYKSTDANTLGQPLTYDGIQSLIYKNAGIGSTVGVGGETPIVRQPAAANGALAQSDIDNLLEAMYLNSRANPEYLLVSVKDHKKITQIVANGTNFRVTSSNGAGLGDLMGGFRATKYINQTTGRVMDIVMLPYLPQGTIIACSMTIPFPVAEISRPPLRIEYNRELWAVEYPPDQGHMTQWKYSAFGNETMVCQFLGGLGIINGITLS